ncbi:putative signal transducing protein [Thalassotalea algicola]|nr:DUF2007 domain-containing protein [Thalassotalea algicola]
MLIFSHENPVLVTNIKNILESERIDVLIKNEFASGGAGELSAFDTWQEVWLINDKDEAKALMIIKSVTNKENAPDWFCPKCKEANGAAFEVCWNCDEVAN